LKKAGFPDRENLVSDIPKEQLGGFVAGSDSVFDQVVQEERDAEDDDSLTALYQEAGEFEEEEEEEQFESPQQEEEQQQERNDDYYTDVRHFDQVQMDPTSVKGQCPIAEVLFKPAFAFTPIHDNDYSLKNGVVVREMMLTRIKLPAGYNEDVTVSVHKNRELHLSISEITSNFQAEIICGRKLNKEQPGLVADLCRVLQQKHRHTVGENSTKGSKFEHYTIKLPKDVEDQFRTPFDECQRVHASCAFYHVKIPQTNTIFLYCFNLVKQVGAYGATSDVKGNIGKETVYMDNSGSGNGTANKVRNNLFAKKKKSVVSSSQRSASNLSKSYYDYSTVTSVLKSYETMESVDSDDSSSLSSTESIDKTNTPFSVSSISIPAIISSSSSSVSSSAAPAHSLPKSLSYFTSRSSSTNYPFQRGEHVRKKQPFVETVKEEDCEEGVNTVESTKSTSVSLFSQIKTKRPTVFADRGYSRCYNDRDDDDASFHSSRTSDKTNTDNNHFWYKN